MSAFWWAFWSELLASLVTVVVIEVTEIIKFFRAPIPGLGCPGDVER